MPGKPIGTIYAELDLDTTKYTKAQQQILQGATSTALNVEKNWRIIGEKSDVMYNAMKQNITNAYEMIKNKAGTSAAEIVRAEQAKNAKIAALDAQQYGVQTSVIDKIKANWIAASIAIYAAIRVIGKAWDFLKEGAEYKEQYGILTNLAKKYNTTADEIVTAMARASEGLIANADLMQVALGGIAKGLTPKQLIELAGAAEILGDAVGKSATVALQDLTEALETGRSRGLKTYLGGALDLKEAMGDVAGKLTDTEKAQAMYNLTMIQAIKLQEQQTGKTSEMADKIEALGAAFRNASTDLKSMTVDIAEWVLKACTQIELVAAKAVLAIENLKDKLKLPDLNMFRVQGENIGAPRGQVGRSGKPDTSDLDEQRRKVAELQEQYDLLSGKKKESSKPDAATKKAQADTIKAHEDEIEAIKKKAQVREKGEKDKKKAEKDEEKAEKGRMNMIESGLEVDKTKREANATFAGEEITLHERTAEQEAAIDDNTHKMKQEQDLKEHMEEKALTAAKIQALGESGDAIMSMAQGSSERAFKMGKAMSIVAAIMNTYEAVTAALANKPGPPWSYAFAAAALVYGMAQVNMIRQQQFQARKFGGAVSPEQTYLVGEAGPELLHMGTGKQGRIQSNASTKRMGNQKIEFHFHGTIIDKKAVNEFAELIYPRLKRLEAWGH